MIEVRGLEKSYTIARNRLRVLQGLDLRIEKGEFTTVMGSSGSGKSTLMNILGLMDEYDAGEYYLDGTLMKDLGESRAARYRSRLLGFVFQSFNLIAFKNAAENVALPLYYQKIGRKERDRLARAALERVGLLGWALHHPHELSGGQQQRVAIARALVSRPKVILADEPTGALDSTTSKEVMALLREINREGVTFLIVTHEHNVAALSDRVIHLSDGRIDGDERRDGAGLAVASAGTLRA